MIGKGSKFIGFNELMEWIIQKNDKTIKILVIRKPISTFILYC